MFGGDEVRALVFDIGTSYTRVGYAGEDIPKSYFPTAIGRVYENPNTDQNVIRKQSYELESSPQFTTFGKKVKKNYLNTQLKRYKHHMEISCPIQHGQVMDWDAIERIWQYALKIHLKVNPAEHPIMIAECCLNTADQREKLLEICFEQINCPAIYLAKDSMLASFSVGRGTSLVLDVGGGITTAIPMHEGYVINRGIQATKVAGNMLDNVMKKLLFETKGKEMQAKYMYGNKRIGPKGTKNKLIAEKDYPYLTDSYHKYACRDILQDLRENICRVSVEPFRDSGSFKMPTAPYELPDGTMLEVGVERFHCGECLFSPDLTFRDHTDAKIPVLDAKNFLDINNYNFKGLTSMVTQAIDSCDVDIRKELYGNVVLSGGGSLIPGLKERLNKELIENLPPAFKVKIHCSGTGGDNDRKYGVWTGGSILSSLGTFHQLWFSRAEYEEHGTINLGVKCP